MRRCPSREELRRMLAEELTGSEVIALQKHVDGCRSCQERLEILSRTAAEFSLLPESATRNREGKDADLEDASLTPRQEFLDRLMVQGPPDVAGSLVPAESSVVAGSGDSATTGDPAATSGRGANEAGWPSLPGYEILGVLGQGGMGQVYRARDLRLNRLVALKVIAVHATPEQRARFQREAEAAARFQHPHIVQVYEVGEHEGRPYLTLELVEGGSLAHELLGAPQSARAAAELVLILAQAMHYAHQQGIIHRDLKPANILLASVVRNPLSVARETGSPTSNYGLRTTDYGLFPKITDFGLAKLLDQDRAQTHSGLIVGTPTYMAPEQAAGSGKAVGPAADVYALGVILYELLTGRPPFQGETPLETLQQVVSVEPVSPSRLRPKLPSDLQTICLKCLEKEPHQRYASAAALAEDLQRFLADEPIRARSVSRRERLWRWCRRNPKLAFLSAAVALLLLIVAGGSSLGALWLRAERNRAVFAEQDAIDKLRQSYLAQAHAGRLGGVAGQGYRGLELIEQAMALKGAQPLTPSQILEFRNEAIACLAMPDLRLIQEQDSGGAYWMGGAAFDPLLERYTCIDSRDRHLVIRRFSDNEILARLPPPPGLRFWFAGAAFSANGRFLAANYDTFQGMHRQLVWDLTTSKVVLDTPSAGGDADFSADNHRLAVFLVDGNIGVYQLPECRNPQRLGQGLSNPSGVRFDPAGRRLACADDKSLHIFDLATGRELAAFILEGGGSLPDWSPDGRWLAVGSADRCIYVYDATELRLRSVLKGHEAAVLSVTFNAAVTLLASWSWDGTTRLWDPVSGRQWLSAPGAFLRFSSDGRRLGFCKDTTTFGVWEVAEKQVCRRLHHAHVGNQRSRLNNAGPSSVDFSEDGRLLASSARDGIRLYDTAAAREVAHLVGGSDCVLFDPVGEGLLTFGQEGLFHWPVHAADPRKPEELCVGPPRTLYSPGTGPCKAAWDRWGTRLAFTDRSRSRAVVLPGDAPCRQIELADRDRIHSIALSPDGKWAVAAAWQDPRVKVWETDTGTPAVMLGSSGPTDYIFSATFSADNQWLVTGSEKEFRWWRVGSWEQGPRISRGSRNPGFAPLAFARDIPLLAITATAQTVRLVDPVTGGELATLTPPDRHIIVWLCFSPDGSQLAAATQDSIIHLWDLRLLRRELAQRQLDWNLPPYPPKTDSSPQSIQVRVEPADAAAWKAANDRAHLQFQVGLASFLLALNPFHVQALLQRAEAYTRLGEQERASADYRRAVQLLPAGKQQRIVGFAAAGSQPFEFAQQRANMAEAWEKDPDNPKLCNNLAWLYLTGPPDLRAPAKALPLAQKAIARAPGPMYRNTLGLVYYRLGRYREAVNCLEQNLKENQQYVAYDLFFLAMSYHQLHQTTEARNCYERARQWLQKQASLSPVIIKELGEFQAEAEALLEGTKP